MSRIDCGNRRGVGLTQLATRAEWTSRGSCSILICLDMSSLFGQYRTYVRYPRTAPEAPQRRSAGPAGSHEEPGADLGRAAAGGGDRLAGGVEAGGCGGGLSEAQGDASIRD